MSTRHSIHRKLWFKQLSASINCRVPTWIALACLTLISAIGIDMSQAAMLVYEPFAGYTAGNINGQLPNANTLGLNTTVGWTESGSGAGTINVVATGLTFSNLSVSGGAVSNPTSGIETATAQLSSAITGDLYESYLINIGSASATSAIFTSFGDSATGNTNRRFRVASESTNTHLIGTKYNTNAVVNGDAGLARDTVYMMLGRFTNVGGDTSVTSGVATAYALTAAQFDHFKALGMNDSDLDAATTGSADDNVTAKATDTLTSGTVTLPSNYFFQLVTTNAASNTFTIDEVRFGHSFADVTPVPEPNTCVLTLLIGMVAMFARQDSSRNYGKRRTII